jgi:Mce-associated membrane protein
MKRNPVVTVAATLAVAALVAAAWFGWSWYSAAHSSSLAYDRTRDSMLQAADQAVINFNTLNYKSPQTGLQLWLSSSTGSLRSQISQAMSTEVQTIQQRKTVTTARILDSAVTQLDTDAGTGTVMLAVAVTVDESGSSPFTRQESEVGTLADTSAGWKLSGLSYPSGSSTTP